MDNIFGYKIDKNDIKFSHLFLPQNIWLCLISCDGKPCFAHKVNSRAYKLGRIPLVPVSIQSHCHLTTL